jgi:hypothetical protein
MRGSENISEKDISGALENSSAPSGMLQQKQSKTTSHKPTEDIISN